MLILQDVTIEPFNFHILRLIQQKPFYIFAVIERGSFFLFVTAFFVIGLGINLYGIRHCLNETTEDMAPSWET
jgi:hypothetical protein